MSAMFLQEVSSLAERSVAVAHVDVGSQNYAVVRQIDVPSPPWEARQADIMIALPAVDGAALDAFYLRVPFQYDGGAHPRVNGATIRVEECQWQLVSWHYADRQPWQVGRDNLETHIAHCKGFFWHRGATNAIR